MLKQRHQQKQCKNAIKLFAELSKIIPSLASNSRMRHVQMHIVFNAKIIKA